MVNNSINNSVYEDFSVENGASGSSRVLRVENNNDTASSSAAIETQVGGTIADDVYFRYIISTTNSWAHGIDQTDSQSFNIAYNAGAVATPSTTKAIKSTTSGCLLYPCQPIFKAYITNSIANVTGDGTTYILIFDTEEIDQNSNFNTGNGRFTVPKNGIYLFSTSFIISNIGTHNQSFFKLVKNGTDEITQAFYNPSQYKNTSNDAGVSSSLICQLSANDYIDARITIFGSTKTIGIRNTLHRNFFGGSLLG